MLNGPRAAHIQDGEEIGVQGRFPARNLNHVGAPLVAHHGINHALDGRQIAMLPPVRPAGRVANRAAQIAEIVNLDQGEAGVLFVVRTQAAIVGTSPFHRGIEVIGHLRRLQENLAAAPVVIDIICHQNALVSMLRTPFKHVN